MTFILWFAFTAEQFLLQGPPCLSVQSNLALTDRNIDAKNSLKVVLKPWDYEFFSTTTHFCEMLTVRPLLDSMLVTFRVPNSSSNCLPRGMGKMRNQYFYSSRNWEMGNKLFSFPREWGINLPPRGSPKFPKISNHLNLKQIQHFFEPIFYSIQMWKTIHFSSLLKS